MMQRRAHLATAALLCMAGVLTGCEHHFFHSKGLISSEGGQFGTWSRIVQGCSPDPLDGLPPGKSATVFTFYWDNPADRAVFDKKPPPPPQKQLAQLAVRRVPAGFSAVLKRSKYVPDSVLDSSDCSTFNATTRPGKPVIEGGRPTVDGTLDLDCRVAGSHLKAAIQFTGCEF